MLVKVAHKWLLSHLFAVAACGCSLGQAAPATPDRPWTSPDAQQIRTFSSSVPQPPFTIDPNKAYSLPELVDLAEQHNPATSLAWERAKSQAAVLGIARSEWYPVLSAVAAAQVQRFALLFNTNFIRQTVSDAQPALMLNYTILDFGRRSARVEAAGAELLATDFGFNDTHRRIIYQVEESLLSRAEHGSAAAGGRGKPAECADGTAIGGGSAEERAGDSAGCARGPQRDGAGAVRFAIGDWFGRNRSRRSGDCAGNFGDDLR